MIQLVSSDIWQKALKEYLQTKPIQGISDGENKVQRLLSYAHNRHIGLAPRLASTFIMATHSQAKLYDPWDRILYRLNKEYAESDGKNAGPFSGHHQSIHSQLIRFDVSLGFMVSRLLFPLVEFATDEMGEIYLFCEDKMGAGPSADNLKAYEKELLGTVRELANNRSPRTALFWKDCAIALGTLVQSDGRSSEKPHLSDTNLPSLGLLTRLEPDLPFRPPRMLDLRTPIPDAPLNDRRMKKSGRRGIYVTRQEEALNRMLHSEMAYPPLMRLDRIVNTGFLAFEKPPKPIKMRDILIVGVLPSDFYGTPMADFIKTCWFDFVMRLSRILHHNGLEQSEFRWIEGDQFGRVRSRGIALKTLPWLDLPLPSTDIKAYRQQFLTSLRWLPDYIDLQATWVSKDPRAIVIPNEPVSSIGSDQPIEQDDDDEATPISPNTPQAQWFKFAWENQKELAIWEGDNANIVSIPQDHHYLSTSLDLQKYAFVSVMPFLPAALKSEDDLETNQKLMFDLRQVFRFGRQRNRFLTMTWAPDTYSELNKWGMQTSRRSMLRLFKSPEENKGQAADEDEAAMTIQEIAGRLEKIWLEQFMKEIQYGG